MICPSCGKSNHADAAFCTACGKMIGGVKAEEAAARPAASDTVQGMKTLQSGLPSVVRRADHSAVIASLAEADRSYIADVSISLAAMGVRSPAKTGLMVLGVVLGLVALGAGGMYLVLWLTMPEPAAVASVPEPDEEPVDLGLMVMRSHDQPDGGAAAHEADEATAADDNGAPGAGATKTPPRRPSSPQPPPRRASSTTIEAPAPPAAGTPATSDDEPMDMDTYSSRVRGLVTVFYAAQAQRCFPASARGTVVVRFTIEPDGRVRDPRVVQDTTGDPSVGQCLVGQISQWHLTPPPDGQPTAFALTFAQ